VLSHHRHQLISCEPENVALYIFQLNRPISIIIGTYTYEDIRSLHSFRTHLIYIVSLLHYIAKPESRVFLILMLKLIKSTYFYLFAIIFARRCSHNNF